MSLRWNKISNPIPMNFDVNDNSNIVVFRPF